MFSRCRTLDDLLAVAEREGIDLWELEVAPVLMATIEGCEDEERPAAGDRARAIRRTR